MLDSVRAFYHRATAAWAEAVKRHRDLEVLDLDYHKRHRAEQRRALELDESGADATSPTKRHRASASKGPKPTRYAAADDDDTSVQGPSTTFTALSATTGSPLRQQWLDSIAAVNSTTDPLLASSRRLLGACSPVDESSTSALLRRDVTQATSSASTHTTGLVRTRTLFGFGPDTAVARRLEAKRHDRSAAAAHQIGRPRMAHGMPDAEGSGDFTIERTMTLNALSRGPSSADATRAAASTHLDRLDPATRQALPAYRAALAGGVAAAIFDLASRRVAELKGGYQATVRAIVTDLAQKKCPPPRGVLKALKRGGTRRYAVPMGLDPADEAATAAVAQKPATAIAVSRFDYNITAEQLRTLNGRSWLNDQVINLYCRMVQEAFPSVFTLGSFLLTKLAAGGTAQDALRWTNAIDVFGFEKLLVVHNNGVHWTVAVVNNMLQRLEYYDSMGGTGDAPLDLLASFLDEEWRLKKELVAAKRRVDTEGAAYTSTITNKQLKRIQVKGSTPPPAWPPSKWPRYTPGRSVPQQRNSDDCGVFACQFCVQIASGAATLDAVSQADMPFYRQLMLLELLEGRLLPRLP